MRTVVVTAINPAYADIHLETMNIPTAQSLSGIPSAWDHPIPQFPT
jgi:hypothetical protein